MSELKHIVMFSGGVCSWAAAKRVVDRHGVDGVVLLFADTKMEDEDLYRFLDQAAANVGAELVKIADGRTPWEVMRDEKLLANTRMDACSKILKRNLLDKWMKEHGDPETTTIHFGLDWEECQRLERLRKRKAPWRVESYTCTEKPLLTKPKMIEWLKREGLVPPRLYAMGFPHNNCGGFCVKAGQTHFALLLRTMPERYALHEKHENELRASLGWRQTILRDARGGTVKPLSLTEFRERIEAKQSIDLLDWGGCGCAVE